MAHTLDRGLCIDWIASNSRNTSARSWRDWLEQVICLVGNCSLRIKVRLGVEERVWRPRLFISVQTSYPLSVSSLPQVRRDLVEKAPGHYSGPDSREPTSMMKSCSQLARMVPDAEAPPLDMRVGSGLPLPLR